MRLLSRLPWLIRLQLLGLGLAVFATAMVCNVIASGERESAVLALPDVEDVVWEQRVDRFANRLVVAFHVPPRKAPKFAAWILDSAARHRLEPELLASVIYVESTFDRRARSSMGAIGPAQVRPSVWARVCRGNLQNPADNIDCGAHILASYMSSCGGRSCALAQYNVGPFKGVSRAGKRYVAKVDRSEARLGRAFL